MLVLISRAHNGEKQRVQVGYKEKDRVEIAVRQASRVLWKKSIITSIRGAFL